MSPFVMLCQAGRWVGLWIRNLMTVPIMLMKITALLLLRVQIQFTFFQIIIGVKVIYSSPVFSWAENDESR